MSSPKGTRRISWLNVALVVIAIVAAGLATVVRLDVDPAGLEAKYAADPASRFVEAGGIRFHITDRGEGPVVVLLHGYSISLLAWQPAAELLAKDHRVISIDLPGHGLTGPDPQGRYTLAGIAESIDALMTALGISRFALAGNSLGGAIALNYAVAHPDKLDALVLVDAGGGPIMKPGSGPVEFELQAMPVVGDVIAWITPKNAVHGVLEDTFGDPSKMTDDEVTWTYELLLRAGNRAAQRRILLAALGSQVFTRAAEIETPTLVLWGNKDTWIDPANAEWFGSHLPHATVQVLEGLGHMPMLEGPERTVAAMEAFLRANGS